MQLLKCLLIIVPLSVTGCSIRDNSTRPVDQPVIVEKPIPDSATVAKVEQIKQTVETSANNTQNTLSGLVNASISKLAERVTGIDAKVDRVTGFETEIKEIAALKLQLRDLSAQIDLRAEFNSRIDKLETKIQLGINANAQATAEIGKKVETKLENIQATAGRDVNMLPQAAVDVIVSNSQIFAGVIAGLCSLAATVVSVLARNSRKRADARAQLEREERKQMYDLLQQFISQK